MRSIFVDTSAWVALFQAKSDDHASCVREFKAITSRGARLLTSDYVFDEAVTLARVRMGHPQAVRLGVHLLGSQGLHWLMVDSSAHKEAWELFQKYHDKVLSFTDCTSFVLMRRTAIMTALSLDDDFRWAGFEVIP